MFNNVYVRGCIAQIFDFENEKKKCKKFKNSNKRRW